MGDGAGAEAADARVGLRARRAARRRGDRDAGDLSVTSDVVVFHAAGCHLCERALAIVEAAQEELGFELREVAIDGDPELERAYREWIPVVEIDGRRRFVYHVDPNALRRAVTGAAS